MKPKLIIASSNRNTASLIRYFLESIGIKYGVNYVYHPADVEPLLGEGNDQILYIVDLVFPEGASQDDQRNLFVQNVRSKNQKLRIRLFDVQNQIKPEGDAFEVHVSPEEIKFFLLTEGDPSWRT